MKEQLNTFLPEEYEKELLLVGSNRDDFDRVIRIQDNNIDLQFYHWQEFHAQRNNQRYDLAIVFNALEHMQKSEGFELLARLRDVHARRVIVCFNKVNDHESGFTQQDMLGMAFINHGTFLSESEEFFIYRYSLRDYKQTPEWLNDRFWANPELFGKFRW